jgi:metallo-beta-lactamase class B
MKRIFTLLPLLVTLGATAQPGRYEAMSMEQKVAAGAGFHEHRAEPMEGFRIVGNIYYVGASDLASYLIATPEGHILVDTGVSEMSSQIRHNVEALGFHMSDIKYMLASHAHFDHIQGHAVIQRMTGAQVVVMEADADAIEAGQDLSPLGFEGWEPVRVDSRIQDGESVTLGGTTLTATWAPGHTPGCTTWTTTTQDNGDDIVVSIFGCNGPNDGVQLLNNPRFPNIIEQTRFGFDNLAKLNPDIYLTGHNEAPFEGIVQLMRVQTRPHPLLGQLQWQDLIAQRRASIEARIEAEMAAAR